MVSVGAALREPAVQAESPPHASSRTGNALPKMETFDKKSIKDSSKVGMEKAQKPRERAAAVELWCNDVAL